jgi:hypothetical membrane protein
VLTVSHKTALDDALYALYFGIQLLLSLVGIYGAWYSNTWLVRISTLAYCFHGVMAISSDSYSCFTRFFWIAYAVFGIERHVYLVMELKRGDTTKGALLEHQSVADRG